MSIRSIDCLEAEEKVEKVKMSLVRWGQMDKVLGVSTNPMVGTKYYIAKSDYPSRYEWRVFCLSRISSRLSTEGDQRFGTDSRGVKNVSMVE